MAVVNPLCYRLVTPYCFLLLFLLPSATAAQNQRWSEQKANDWYAQQPWLVGSDYIPKSAIN